MDKRIYKLVNDIHLNRKREVWPVVYVAYSKQNLFLKEHISKFVLSQNVLPLNPFMNFNYFLGDSINRQLIYTGNDNLIRISDSIWTFGQIADGVVSELVYCCDVLKKPVKHFSIIKEKSGLYSFKKASSKEIELEKNSKSI